MTSSILRIILTSWVARRSCCCFPIKVSNTFCFFMSLVPFCLQSTPRCEHFCSICALRTEARLGIGASPLFSARAIGICSRASANPRTAYCSTPETESANSAILSEQAISAAPPPYTIRLSRIRLRQTHMASWSERLASSMIIWFPPRMSTVTALERGHFSMTTILSFVVPKDTSRTIPAVPSFSGASSSNLGMMRAPVAIAISSISTPPTQRTAGSLFWSRRWLASSSKPHWHRTRVAPESLHFWTMSLKYFCSLAYSSL
mmetsp:Transcript_6126/g.11306  ORF Transcript_6126/g.11306 Transcript_6126/m.11306 type:complete len:261 (-) Transcript_6126:910-1692(-)